MCYSAKVIHLLRELERRFGGHIDWDQIEGVLARRLEDPSVRIPRAFEANFGEPRDTRERRLHDLVAEYRSKMTTAWERDLFAQRKRLADAERKLQTKVTKAAENDARIARNKVDALATRLANLRSPQLVEDDFRIFPMYYAPIVVREGDENRIVLARYHCRGANQPETIDRKFPGLYNARRDNLAGYWKNEFAHTHAAFLIDAFYEHVSRPGQQPENVVLKFEPRPAHVMTVASLYARWKSKDGKELISFAAITDNPPPEIAAAGHDRCVVSLKNENVQAWLAPRGRSVTDLQAILGDVERPYYQHRIAA